MVDFFSLGLKQKIFEEYFKYMCAHNVFIYSNSQNGILYLYIKMDKPDNVKLCILLFLLLSKRKVGSNHSFSQQTLAA